MENKLIGSDIDIHQHSELLKNFSEFIKNFSPLLDSVEKYYQNLVSTKLIDNGQNINEKIRVIENITTCLTNCIPLFVEFSILENKLDILNKQK